MAIVWTRRPGTDEYRAALDDGRTAFVEPAIGGWAWTVAHQERWIVSSPEVCVNLPLAFAQAEAALGLATPDYLAFLTGDTD
jgi:hypothetical protein